MALKDIKNWSTEIETEITQNWKESELYKFNPKTKKKIYSIDTPPPYINSPIHMGHAVTYCFMDFFARYRRMKGQEVLFPLGLDRNGLPIIMANLTTTEMRCMRLGMRIYGMTNRCLRRDTVFVWSSTPHLRQRRRRHLLLLLRAGRPWRVTSRCHRHR